MSSIASPSFFSRTFSKLFWPTRTIVFYLILTLWTVVWTPLMIVLIYLTPFRKRHFFVKTWSIVAITLCHLICGIRWQLKGTENIPDNTCVIISNHQSTWETFFIQTLVTPQTQVLKQELLKIPFFGWALAATRPIAINRNDVRLSLQQIRDQGKQSLDRNIRVLIFPEGTRTAPGTLGKFSRGGARLAKAAEVGILPIAHNAGSYWPSTSWIKKPGTIKVEIGPVIDTEHLTPAQANDQARAWIAQSIERMA